MTRFCNQIKIDGFDLRSKHAQARISVEIPNFFAVLHFGSLKTYTRMVFTNTMIASNRQIECSIFVFVKRQLILFFCFSRPTNHLGLLICNEIKINTLDPFSKHVKSRNSIKIFSFVVAAHNTFYTDHDCF